MSKLALPVRAFIEDYVKRAFPNRDWSRGSAINDLVIKSFAAIMQPLRHEIDVLKINQSIANWQHMRTADLDDLAANWGKFRQRGGLSVGTVRIFFDSAADYQFSTLEFFAADGTTFILSAPVRITATDLFARRLADGTFYFDVTVQSVGTGSRYALPAGSIVGVRNKPSGVVRVENLTDFAVTAPDESNFDVINSMFKNIGMKNLVSRQSIRAPILDLFPGVVDLFIAGAGHQNMLRDLVTITLPTGPAKMHLGGMTDIWLNTTSVGKRQVLIGYVPSSQEIKIVSAEQASSSEVIFTFTRGQYTLDGLFSDPDQATLTLDESGSISFDMQDVPVSAFVLGLTGTNRAQVASKDIISGLELLSMVGPNAISPYVADLTGLNFHNTDVKPNDYIFFNDKYYRIARAAGLVLDLAPSVQPIQAYLYAGADAVPGSRSLTISGIHTAARINDRLVIPTSPAAGQYLVTGIATDTVRFGNIAATGKVTGFTGPDVDGVISYTYVGPGITRPLLPPEVGTAHYLYFSTDAGYDQTKYFPIVEIIPGLSSTTIKVLDGASASTIMGSDVSVIAGLFGTLPRNTLVTVERDNGTLQAQDAVQNFATGHTHYSSVTSSIIPSATTTLSAIGIGASAAIGDLIEFTDVPVADNQLQLTGGDGTRLSAVITDVTDLDNVVFKPSFGFDIPDNTRFAVVKNDLLIASGVVTNVDTGNKDFSLASVPPGIGDGIGMIVKDPSDNLYVITNSTAGNVRTLQFNPPSTVRTLTFISGGYVAAINSDIGKPVVQIDGSNTYNGVLYDFNNSTRTWHVIPNGISDVFSSTATFVTVTGSTATGKLSVAASAPFLIGYDNAVSGDLGDIVRQGTYIGTLDSYNNVLFQWKVKPMSDADLFDSTTEETFVDLGGGIPTVGHGSGTLQSPAGPLELASGTVTFTLDDTPAFTTTNTVEFFSRFGRHAGMFDGEVFSVSTNGSVNTTPFSGVSATGYKLVVLLGDTLGTYDIDKVNPFSVRVIGAPSPQFIRIPNAPTERQFSLSVALPVGTTTIAQTDIGLWGYAGRVVRIGTPAGDKLYTIASINNDNSIELEIGLQFAIYPNSGFTWEVVEALNLPYWIVPTTAFKPYRIFRVPTLGDLIENNDKGSFTNISGQQDKFTDNSVDFSALLENSDFINGEYKLFIDSGSEASSIPLTIIAVTGTNTVQLDTSGDFTGFTLTETNVSYRIVLENLSEDKENWMNATVTSVSPLELTLDVPNGTDFIQDGSYERWIVDVRPDPAGTLPGAWSYGDNWHTEHRTITSYNVSTKVLRLDTTAGSFTTGAGDAILEVAQVVRVALRQHDRTAAVLDGTALNTFNYYADKFFELPIVKINSVEMLDPTSLQPISEVDYDLVVGDSGLRYSAKEINTLRINDVNAVLRPLRITYITDSLIGSVDNYLNQDDTRVINANQLAKRMETLSVSVSISIRSTLTQPELASQIASFINSRRSTLKLTKADIMKDLLDRDEVAFVDLGSFTLSGTYYKADGTQEVHTDVDELFGAETSCYLADNISVIAL